MKTASFVVLGCFIVACLLVWLVVALSRSGTDVTTPRAGKVLMLARYEALRLDDEYLRTEHILLALVREVGCVAEDVLTQMGVDLDTLEEEVKLRVEVRPSIPSSTKTLWTPGARLALEFAMEEADKQGHEKFGTGHLLLGLILEDDGIAAEMLRSNGVQLAAARKKVMELLAAQAHD